jgi:hypothetical protein
MEVAQVTEGRNPFAPPESIADQIRRKGIRPIRSADELRADVFRSDAELQEFLDDLYASRRSRAEP